MSTKVNRGRGRQIAEANLVYIVTVLGQPELHSEILPQKVNRQTNKKERKGTKKECNPWRISL